MNWQSEGAETVPLAFAARKLNRTTRSLRQALERRGIAIIQFGAAGRQEVAIADLEALIAASRRPQPAQGA